MANQVHFGYFTEVDPRNGVWFSDMALEILSPVGYDALVRSEVASIDVVRWDGGYEFYDTLDTESGVYVGRFKLLWDGVGRGDTQKVPFVAVPGKPGEFIAITLMDKDLRRVDVLKFSESGKQIILNRTYGERPSQVLEFRLEKTELRNAR